MLPDEALDTFALTVESIVARAYPAALYTHDE